MRGWVMRSSNHPVKGISHEGCPRRRQRLGGRTRRPDTSIVLDPASPALRRLVGLTKAGLGGRVGDGRQWFPWIHVTDWLAVARACLGLDPVLGLTGRHATSRVLRQNGFRFQFDTL